MKKLALFFALVTGTASLSFAQQPAPVRTPPMKLTTSAFADGTVIPDRYSMAAAAGAVSPELNWTNVPAGTQSFVLYMHDIDVVRNKGLEDYLHWLVWNIPGTATSLHEKMPDGASLPDGSGQTSAMGPKYTGPGAPASGPLHHYIFELYALDIKVNVVDGANAADAKASIMSQIPGHILGKATYVGQFKRPM